MVVVVVVCQTGKDRNSNLSSHLKPQESTLVVSGDLSKIPSVLFWIKFCSFMTKSQRNVLTFFFYIYYLLIWKKNRFIEIIEIFKLLPISFPTCQLSKPHVSPSSSCLDSGFPSVPKTCTNTNTSSSTANFRASIVASGQSGSEGFELLVMKTRTKSK